MQAASSGGRRLTQAALAARAFAFEEGRAVSRKELAQAAREAEKALMLRPALRLVLGELVGVWGETEVNGRLLVWPSNDYLMQRTGLSERSIRYAIRGLTELQVITPRDSANGKRFAVRGRNGDILDAFGLDLTPLYARRGEFEQRVFEQKALRDAQGRIFDEITICRRATEEALSAIDSHFPGVSVTDLEEKLSALKSDTPRRGFMGHLGALLDRWNELRNEAEKRFYDTGNGGKDCRHKETNNDFPSESCSKGFRGKAGAFNEGERSTDDPSIGVIAEACPAVLDFGHELRVERDLVAAARQLRSSIGAHESAWNEALQSIGLFRASAAVVLVLQIHTYDVESGENRIRNPGGYFRAMVRMIAEGRVKLSREFETLRRRRAS